MHDLPGRAPQVLVRNFEENVGVPYGAVRPRGTQGLIKMAEQAPSVLNQVQKARAPDKALLHGRNGDFIEFRLRDPTRFHLRAAFHQLDGILLRLASRHAHLDREVAHGSLQDSVSILCTWPSSLTYCTCTSGPENRRTANPNRANFCRPLSKYS